jgi:hypothetical protein
MATGVANTDDRILPCGECGASVYRNHLDTGLAGYMAGKLLCVHCFKERKGGPRPSQEAPTPAPAAAATPAPIGADDLPTLPLDDGLEITDEPPANRTAHGASAPTSAPAPTEAPAHYHRPLNKTGAGATRCRTFHCKLSEEGVRRMDELINEFCDANPDVEIKFTTSTVGTWTGKHAEPNLIITLFY